MTLKPRTNVLNVAMNGKPRYTVPTMKEIESIPWNGYNVVSTFSGGGGSCLGYRMAGYRVLYANEFVEEARKTYTINNPHSIIDGRDIRTVTGRSILDRIGLDVGDIDIFDGSPPCSAFSTAGKRSKGWGKEHRYSDDKLQRVDDLFFEYSRLLKELQPKVFVAENVSGLIKGKAKGYFKVILKELTECGYDVRACLLNAKWLGVPQSRERIIFIGVRSDIGLKPAFPKPLPYYHTLRNAFEDLDNDIDEIAYRLNEAKKYSYGKVLRKLPKNPSKRITGGSVMNGSYFNLVRESMTRPASTICQLSGSSGACGNCHPFHDRKFTIPELKRITSIPDDFITTGDYAQQWERLGRMVPPVMMFHIAKTIERKILCKMN